MYPAVKELSVYGQACIQQSLYGQACIQQWRNSLSIGRHVSSSEGTLRLWASMYPAVKELSVYGQACIQQWRNSQSMGRHVSSSQGTLNLWAGMYPAVKELSVYGQACIQQWRNSVGDHFGKLPELQIRPVIASSYISEMWTSYLQRSTAVLLKIFYKAQSGAYIIISLN